MEPIKERLAVEDILGLYEPPEIPEKPDLHSIEKLAFQNRQEFPHKSNKLLHQHVKRSKHIMLYERNE